MHPIKAFLEKSDRFAAHAGVEIVSAAPGHAVTRLKIQPFHLNGAGVVHGGAIFTLADFAFAAASNAHGKVAVGINATITYQNAAREGVLTAEAREVGSNPKLATYSVSVSDEAGQLVALFQGLVYRKSAAIPFAAHG